MSNAVVFIEGFDSYTTDPTDTVTGILRRWSCAFPSDKQILAGRFGGQCLTITHNGGIEDYNAVVSATPLTSYTLGMAIKTNSVGVWLFGTNDGSNNGVCVALQSDGSLTVNRGVHGGTVLCTSTPSLLAINVWYYIEVSIVADASVGTVSLSVDGLVVATGSNLNTGNGITSIACYEPDGSGISTSYDDIYVSNGIAPLGPQKIILQIPTSDVAGGNWVTSDGGTTKFSLVDEVNEDGLSTYITGNNSGDQQLFKFPALPTNAQSVSAVQVVTVAEKSDAALRLITAAISDDNGATAATATPINLNTAFTINMSLFPNAPDGTAWTVSKVNNLSAGPRVV